MAGASSGKLDAVMYTRWMVKVSGLYQLPSASTSRGRSTPAKAGRSPTTSPSTTPTSPTTPPTIPPRSTHRPITTDSLPTFYNITLRLEKKIAIGAGRLYLMADVFNLLNSNMPNRSYSRYPGDRVLPGQRHLNAYR